MPIELTKKLIACASVTPNDAGCQHIIKQFLEPLGFKCETLQFGEVTNLWAQWGHSEPLFVFAGHTDVVPSGPETAWNSPPFQPTERDGYLYGRGATDMKSGLAAMLTAAAEFIQAHPQHKGSIAFLITSDEEGLADNGTVKVLETLDKRGVKIDYAIVGEASSEQHVGDQIRVGRRGSLHGKLVIHGRQGHVAYPHMAENAIHGALAALKELTEQTWDQGNADFPPTTMQISNIHAGTGAANVIPGVLEAAFNFRYSTAVTPQSLQERVMQIFQKHHCRFDIDWLIGAEPFLCQRGKLITAVQRAIQSVTHREPILSTAGGTSDARFIAATGAEVIELGPCHASAHHVNERVKMADLTVLKDCYKKVLEEVF